MSLCPTPSPPAVMVSSSSKTVNNPQLHLDPHSLTIPGNYCLSLDSFEVNAKIEYSASLLMSNSYERKEEGTVLHRGSVVGRGGGGRRSLS